MLLETKRNVCIAFCQLATFNHCRTQMQFHFIAKCFPICHRQIEPIWHSVCLPAPLGCTLLDRLSMMMLMWKSILPSWKMFILILAKCYGRPNRCNYFYPQISKPNECFHFFQPFVNLSLMHAININEQAMISPLAEHYPILCVLFILYFYFLFLICSNL